MAVNQDPFLYNLITGDTNPLIVPGLFQAGATQAVKRGEILEFTYNTNAAWGPWDSDADITTGIAVAACEIKDGDRAGYYDIIVPRPGDVFQFDIDTAAGTTMGTSLYYSSSQEFSASGSHIMAYAVGHHHYPMQGHAADDASGDAGTTVRSISYVDVVFKKTRSWFAICNMEGE